MAAPIHRERFSSDFERLEATTTPEPNKGCWLWIGHIDRDGYPTWITGSVKDGTRKTERVRRSAVRLSGRATPRDLPILDTCGVRSCVNPAHLLVGSNRAKAVNAVVARSHPNLKLTPDVVRAMRLDREAGMTWDAIAGKYGENRETVRQAAGGKTWRWLDERCGPEPTRRSA